MGSSLAVPGEKWPDLFKVSASPKGHPAVDRLTNKSKSLELLLLHKHTPVYAQTVNLVCVFPFQLCCSGACWTLCQLRTKKATWCSFWLHLRTSLTLKSKPSKKTRGKVCMCIYVQEVMSSKER